MKELPSWVENLSRSRESWWNLMKFQHWIGPHQEWVHELGLFFYEYKSSFTLKLELITITKISHLHSLWKSDRLRQLGNGLLHARQENFHASHMIPIIPWRLSRARKFLVRHRRSESRREKILEIARELIVGKTEPRWAFSPVSVESKKTYFIKWFKQKKAILKSHLVR